MQALRRTLREGESASRPKLEEIIWEKGLGYRLRLWDSGAESLESGVQGFGGSDLRNMLAREAQNVGPQQLAVVISIENMFQGLIPNSKAAVLERSEPA